jgi:3-deoxy-D-manno-octulosonic-acid transferase
MIFGMKILALFNAKIKKGISGRKQSLNLVNSAFSKSDKIIWMHAASLGEYEQGLPVLQKLKEKFPKHKILITFFSPSGYENVVKKNHIADAVCYLPFDKKNKIREFVSQFKTDIFFTVKYDFWYHLLAELKKQNTKIYVVSALFYPKQIFIKSYGKWFVNQLKQNVNHFFHQTKSSFDLAQKIGLTNSSISGDTRFDRVRQNLERDNFVEFIAEFKQEKPTVVFGSSWETEERIAKILNQKNKELKLIIAPHDLKRTAHLQRIFPDALLYSQLISGFNSNSEILIIDSIGLLSKIYFYADLAVVGGGFHSAGLHNILEAAVFGIPVLFGNQYKKNPEADELIKQNGGKSFADENALADFASQLLNESTNLKNMGENARNFIFSQPNAAEIVINKVMELWSYEVMK